MPVSATPRFPCHNEKVPLSTAYELATDIKNHTIFRACPDTHCGKRYKITFANNDKIIWVEL